MNFICTRMFMLMEGIYKASLSFFPYKRLI